jgi:hypothetical protein
VTFFAEEFLDMLVDIVTVQSLVSRADDGSPQFGSPRAYQARINFETQNVLGPNNQIVTASGVVWMACIDTIKANDKLAFPDGSSPTILKVAAGSDENGPAYTKLYFQ